jgi:nucleotide-binding universal stress UspA family protein
VRHARVPVLIARWCAPGDLTDAILVSVDDSPESRRAVELAGRLAGARGGTVTILESPGAEPALRRAIAAGSRVLLKATGVVPAVAGEQLPREQAIPAAAAALGASLVVLGVGADADARRTAAQLAERIACSVLVVPTAGPAASRRFTRGRRRDAHLGKEPRAGDANEI